MNARYQSASEAEEAATRKMIRNWTIGIGGTVMALIVVSMAGCPQYNVYTARLDGEATLARADQARQVLVSQAQAELDAAQKRADAIKIMGQAAKDFPEYRQQEVMAGFAEALKEGRINQIIYVPTEANIPVLEAGKRSVK